MAVPDLFLRKNVFHRLCVRETVAVIGSRGRSSPSSGVRKLEEASEDAEEVGVTSGGVCINVSSYRTGSSGFCGALEKKLDLRTMGSVGVSSRLALTDAGAGDEAGS